MMEDLIEMSRAPPPRGEDMPERSTWSEVAYVSRSDYRRRVLEALAARPLGPGDVARATGIRIVHVSRALGELEGEGLVECVNPEVRRRGRMYAITPGGEGIVQVLRSHSTPQEERDPGRGGESGDHGRRIRGATLKRYLDFARIKLGSEALAGILVDTGIDLSVLTDDGWYPVEMYQGVLAGLERRWNGMPGEGAMIEAGRYASKLLGTVRQQIVRAASLEELAERAPIVWNKEFNYGRLEVLVGRGWAVFSHYDWHPFPQLCRIFQGTYMGILELNGVPGKVEKTKCMSLGHDRCEYQVRWDALSRGDSHLSSAITAGG